MIHYYSQAIRDRLEKNSNSTRSLSSRARATRAIERAEFEYTNTRLEQAREPNELFILIFIIIILIIYKGKISNRARVRAQIARNRA